VSATTARATRPPDADAVVAHHAAGVLGRPVRVEELGDALADLAFDTLSRGEEVRSPRRDRWGNWDWSFSDAHRRGELFVPWLDRRLGDAVGGSPTAARWPGGAPFALCLTHDVDSVARHHVPVASVREAVRRLSGDGSTAARVGELARVSAKFALQRRRLGGGTDPRWSFERWLRAEDAHGFHSTFFTFPSHVARPHACDANYRYSDPVRFEGRAMRCDAMFRAIADAGWEIGLHGSYHSATDAEILRGEREALERAIERPVVSTRQHYLHYDPARTPAVHEAAGFRADSTQGFNRSIGFRAGTAFPYRCWDWTASRATSVLEVPQHVMDGALFAPFSLDYDADLAVRHVVQVMDEVERVGGCLTLNFHTDYVDVPTYWTTYERLLAEAARRGAWGCSVGELLDWWTTRAPHAAAAAHAASADGATP
jgi:peptidoglycan/xylan/chitin deacetylase (PgdA/CDA1 family)